MMDREMSEIEILTILILLYFFNRKIMDDSIKINVLMIYFEHWGNEQNKIRKNIYGIQKFQQINIDEIPYLNWIDICGPHMRRMIHYKFIDRLLQEYGGGFQPIDMIYKNIEEYDTTFIEGFLDDYDIDDHDKYYDILSFLPKDELRNVDALVALR